MTDYVTSCTMKIDHLIADVVCIFVYFLILMWATLCWCWWWLWEIKITVYLAALSPCPGHPHWPRSYHWTPSPQSFHLPMCVATGSPLSWSHHLSPHWGQGDIHEVTCWSSLTQRRRSIVWTWSLWKMELLLLYSRLYRYRGALLTKSVTLKFSQGTVCCSNWQSIGTDEVTFNHVAKTWMGLPEEPSSRCRTIYLMVVSGLRSTQLHFLEGLRFSWHLWPALSSESQWALCSCDDEEE